MLKTKDNLKDILANADISIKTKDDELRKIAP
jgi:hypothetical protein